jgi:hypothetical protein
VSDDRGPVHRFEPYADHLVFVISDAEATEGVFDGVTWDRATEGWRIAVACQAAAIRTGTPLPTDPTAAGPSSSFPTAP